MQKVLFDLMLDSEKKYMSFLDSAWKHLISTW